MCMTMYDYILVISPSHSKNMLVLVKIAILQYLLSFFYPVIKTLWNFLCLLRGCVSTQISNLRAKINFAKMLNIVRKSGKLPDFRIIFNIFAKLILTLKFNIWVLTHPLNKHKNFHKVLFIYVKIFMNIHMRICTNI